MWISPKFQLLLVKEYQRLKEEEQKLLGWTAKRELSKINYLIHTDAIKENLIPKEITPAQASVIYASYYLSFICLMSLSKSLSKRFISLSR